MELKLGIVNKEISVCTWEGQLTLICVTIIVLQLSVDSNLEIGFNIYICLYCICLEYNENKKLIQSFSCSEVPFLLYTVGNQTFELE